MPEHDYESMGDEELLKAAQEAGVQLPQQQAPAASAPPRITVNSPPTEQQESESFLTDPHTWEAGAGAAVIGLLAAKFPALRRAAARLTIDAPIRHTADAVMQDIGDSKAAAQKLRDLSNRLLSGGNPTETVGDVVPSQAQRLAQRAIAEPNPQSAAYAQQLAARQAAAPQAAEALIRQGLNAPQEFTTQEQQFLADQRTRAQPLYDLAYSQYPSIKVSALGDILNDPAGQLASKNAVTELNRRGISVGPVTPGGMVENPSLAYVDQVKRELDKQIGAFRRAAVLGSDPTAKAKAASLSGLRNDLVSQADAATTGTNGVSPYATARAQFSSDQKVIDALRSGHEDFDSLSPAELQAQMHGLNSTAEKNAFRSGVAENLIRKVGKTPDTQSGAEKLLRTPDMQAKVSALFDTSQGADAFTKSLENEANLFHFSRDMQAAAGQGTIPASGINLGQVAHLTVNPKLAALKLAASRLMGRGIPSGGISDLMSGTGVQGAQSLEDIAKAIERTHP